jgi:hypothetical protein
MPHSPARAVRNHDERSKPTMQAQQAVRHPLRPLAVPTACRRPHAPAGVLPR